VGLGVGGIELVFQGMCSITLSFQQCLQYSLSFQEKLLRDIFVKYLGLRLRCIILRPVTNKLELLDKFR